MMESNPHPQQPPKTASTGTSAETSAGGVSKSKSKLLSMISPTGHTRHKYKKWYHAIEKQPFQGHTIVVATWHFVHRDERHSIVLCDDTYTMSRSLICDEKDTWCGSPDMGYWSFEWTMGSIADPIHCVIEMVPTLSEGYKYLLSINSVSFETARDIWMKQESATEQIQSRTIETVIQPRTSDSSRGTSRSIDTSISTTSIPGTDPASYRQWIETHWGRWIDYEKTKYGGHKTKVTWKFTIKSNVHQLVLHHSWLSGKKKVFLDTQGEPIMWQKPSILDRNKPFHQTFPIDGVDLTILISKQLQKSAREHSCPYIYDLLIDSVPFDACINIPSPINAVELIVPKHKPRMKRAHTTESYDVSHKPDITRPHTFSDAASIATTAPTSTATSTNPSTRTSPNSTPQQRTREFHEDWSTQFPTSFDTSTVHNKPSLFHMSGQNGNMIPVANVLGVDDGNPFNEDERDTGNPFLSPSPSNQIPGTTTSTTTTTAPAWTAHFD